jgi:hypothetical protein
LLEDSFGQIEKLEPWLKEATPLAEVAILSRHEPGYLGSIPVNAHLADVDGAAQLFLEVAIQFDIVDAEADSFDDYKALVLPDGTRVDPELRDKLEGFLSVGGRLIMSGTAALDPDTGEFDVEVPFHYEGPAPTLPSYLRIDEALVGDTELASDYDYVFYEQAHRVSPAGNATKHGELRRALFNRRWEHFTSHAQAPVGDYLDAPLAVQGENILYFSCSLFGAYREHDYWAYRAIALNALRAFLPQPLVRLTGPGWVEATLHVQSASDDRPERYILHLVSYHPRRTMQPIQHVDQAWSTSGLNVKIFSGEREIRKAYLAPDGVALPLENEGEYASIDMPPIRTHAVVVLE